VSYTNDALNASFCLCVVVFWFAFIELQSQK